MKPVGTILQHARKQAGLELEDIHIRTKIRKKYLEHIEQNNWHALPGVPYIKGFLRSYADVLHLDPDKVVTLFRREFKDPSKKELMPKGMVDAPVQKRNMFLTIQRVITKLFT
jgi:cytoskeletal protein RodZ